MIDQSTDSYASNHSQTIPHYQTMTNLLSSSYLSPSPPSTTLATLPPSSLSSSSSSPSSTTNCTNHDLSCPSSIYHHSAEVIVSPHRSSLMNSTHSSPFHYHHHHHHHQQHQQKLRHRPSEQTDSDCDLDSSSNSVLSSSSSTTNINLTSSSSKLKKRRANLPKDSVRRERNLSNSDFYWKDFRFEYWRIGYMNIVTMLIRQMTKKRIYLGELIYL